MSRGTAADVKGKTPFRESGSGGWLLLAGVVIGWDIVAPECLTTAFRRGCQTPEGMTVLVVTWGVLTAHLFSVLPEKADPITMATKAARYRRAARECAPI